MSRMISLHPVVLTVAIAALIAIFVGPVADANEGEEEDSTGNAVPAGQDVRHQFMYRHQREMDDQTRSRTKDMSAYDPQYNKQPLSDYVPIFTPTDDPALQPPEVHATRGEHDNVIVISWEPVENGSLYLIFRRLAGDVEHAAFIGTTENTWFVDRSATEGLCWRYSVRTVSVESLEGPSSPSACGWRPGNRQADGPDDGPGRVFLPPRDESEAQVDAFRNNGLRLAPDPVSNDTLREGCTCGADSALSEVPGYALIIPLELPLTQSESVQSMAAESEVD